MLGRYQIRLILDRDQVVFQQPVTTACMSTTENANHSKFGSTRSNNMHVNISHVIANVILAFESKHRRA